MNNLIKNIGIYTFSNVLNASIPFVLLPILTNHLSTSDYGILTNYNALINLLIPFIGVNLMSSLQIIYVKRKDDIGSYITSGLFINLVLALILSYIIYLFRNDISIYTGIPIKFIYLTAIYATYNNIVEVLLALWRMEDKAMNYGFFRISRTLLEFSIAVILIIVYDFHFEGSIHAISISYGIGALVAIIFMLQKKILIFSIKSKHIKHLFSYGLPLIPHVLSSVAIMYTDKLMLSALINVEANGIFSVGFMVGQVIGLIQNSFNQAWVPWVFNVLKKNESHGKQKIVRYTYFYFIGIVVLTLLLWLCAPIIYSMIGKSFYSGISLVFWIALGFAFNGMYKMVSVYFFYLEKTNQLAIISFVSAIINVGMNFWLIPVYSITGAAISTMTAMFLQFILTWIWSTKHIKMPWLGKNSLSKMND
ncbi:MAG: hypothetical protein RLZ10_928 [Bacteroidota bacterium]|jgi:O-antigen/teichoic acid export membrane protein